MGVAIIEPGVQNFNRGMTHRLFEDPEHPARLTPTLSRLFCGATLGGALHSMQPGSCLVQRGGWQLDFVERCC
jgi:hypothetical protein